MIPFDRRGKHLRVLLAIRSQGPLRFNQIEARTRLKAPEVDRILRELTRTYWLTAKAIPAPGKRAFAEYHLTKAGRAHLKAFDAYAESLRNQARVVGERTLLELATLYA